MRADSAVDLIKHLVTKPGWRFTPSVSDRFEDAVVVRVDYPAPRFDREEAPDYATEIEANASFVIPVRDLDQAGLCRALLEDALLKIEAHEWREALRVMPTCWAPFHPHRHDGIERWGDPQGDYLFGVV